MEIITHSPQILESRKLQLQFILLNHPMICPRCEKEGDCALQRLVYEYGVEETLYPWERISSLPMIVLPFSRETRINVFSAAGCVRICDEVQE